MSAGREPLEELAESFIERHRRGERPQIAEYTEKHPELAEEIEELFPALLLVEELGSDEDKDAAARLERESETPVRRLGDYIILREIGRGGMGVVFEAVEQSLDRRVALKLLPSHALLSENQRRRFHREAQSAARLHHTNIVPVFGVGEDDGVHYYAMQFISGQALDGVIEELRALRSEEGRDEKSAAAEGTPSLAEKLVSGELRMHAALDTPGGGDEARTRSASSSTSVLTDDSEFLAGSSSRSGYFRNVARLGAQIASALAYAHGEGIVHRDIKPANVLLDLRGHPWVTDFGLAKADDRDSLTQEGEVVGTLGYLAPERLNGWSDPRSDIYSLGLTLYELLTLRRAFEASDRHRLLKFIAEKDPPRPRRIERLIPPDLERIILKAIAKDPGQRYQTAQEMADDLDRLVRGEPIRARPPTAAYLLKLFVKRHTVAVTAVACAMILFAALLLAWIVSLRSALEGERQARNEVKDALNLSKERLSRLFAERAQRSWLDGAYQRAAVFAAGALDQNETAVARGLLYCGRTEAPWRPVWAKRPQRAEGIKFSPDGEILAWGSEFGRIRLVATESRKVIGWLDGHSDSGWIHTFSFSPEGDRLVSAGNNGETLLWDLRSRKLTAKLEPASRIWSAAFRATFHPGGRVVATANREGIIRIWDTETLEVVRELEGHEDRHVSLVFSPDGSILASGGWDDTIRMWNWAEGEEIARMDSKAEQVTTLAFDPSGRMLASGHFSGIIRLWRVHQEVWGTVARLSGHEKEVTCVQFSKDGRVLASSSQDRTIRLWEVNTRTQMRTLEGHADRVTALDFSPDGGYVASSSLDETVVLWNPDDGKALERLKPEDVGHRGRLSCAVFSPEGDRIASSSADGAVIIWNVEGEILDRLKHPGGVWEVTFHPGGRLLASACSDRAVWLWNIATAPAQNVGRLEGHTGTVSHVAFSPCGTRLASGSADQSLRLWDVATHEEIAELRGHSRYVKQVVFSPDGSLLASGSHDTTVRLWDPGTREELAVLNGHKNGVQGLAFSSDGRLLASTGSDMVVVIWDVAAREQLKRLEGHTRTVQALAFSPHGRYVAAGDQEDIVRLWDVVTGRCSTILDGHASDILALGFSPDGTRLASGGRDGSLVLWRRATDEERTELKGHEKPVVALAVNTDGKRLATGSMDRTIRLWDLEKRKEVARFEGHLGGVLTLAFHPERPLLASGSSDRTIRLWDVDGRREPLLLGTHTESVNSVAFSPNGKLLASPWHDNTVALWDMTKDERVLKSRLRGHVGSVFQVAFAPDGVTLASASRDGSVSVWNPVEGTRALRFSPPAPTWVIGQTGLDGTLAFSPDGAILAVAWNEAIGLWNMYTGKLLGELTGCEGTLGGFGFSSDGSLVAGGSHDRTIRLWDVASRRELVSLPAHGGWVNLCSVTPDDRWVVSAAADNTIRLWNLKLLLESVDGLSRRLERETGLVLRATEIKTSTETRFRNPLSW